MPLVPVFNAEVIQEVYPMAPQEVLEAISRLGENARFEIDAGIIRSENFFETKNSSISVGNLIIADKDSEWVYLIVALIEPINNSDSKRFVAYEMSGFPGALSWKPDVPIKVSRYRWECRFFYPASPSFIFMITNHKDRIKEMYQQLEKEKEKVTVLMEAISYKKP